MREVLLVDLGGVLFSFDHPHRLRELGQCLGLSPDPAAAAVRARVRQLTGYAGTDGDLDAAWCSAFRPDQQVLGLLATQPERLRRTNPIRLSTTR